MESDESLGYHWGSWLGDGIQPLDGLTEGDDDNSLEPSLLLSLAGERPASSPAAEQAKQPLDYAHNVKQTKRLGGGKNNSHFCTNYFEWFG